MMMMMMYVNKTIHHEKVGYMYYLHVTMGIILANIQDLVNHPRFVLRHVKKDPSERIKELKGNSGAIIQIGYMDIINGTKYYYSTPIKSLDNIKK